MSTVKLQCERYSLSESLHRAMKTYTCFECLQTCQLFLSVTIFRFLASEEVITMEPMNDKDPIAVVNEPTVDVMPEPGSEYVTLLQQQQQQHLQKIQQLQQQLQEQQKLNQLQPQPQPQNQMQGLLQDQLMPPASTGVQLPQPLQQLMQGHAGQQQQTTQPPPQVRCIPRG